MAYTTLAAVRSYLKFGIDDDEDDALITDLITKATTLINTITSREFESASASVRYFDALKDVNGLCLYFDRDCAGITEDITNGDATKITSTQYTTIPVNAVADGVPFYGIKLKNSEDIAWTYDDDPEAAISITAHWSYSETPPADIVFACLRLVAWFYKQKDTLEDTMNNVFLASGVSIVPPAMPRDVVEILSRYERMGVY